jgi:hypothetical protein
LQIGTEIALFSVSGRGLPSAETPDPLIYNHNPH